MRVGSPRSGGTCPPCQCPADEPCVALHHRHLIDQAIMHRLSLSPLGTFFAPHSHSGGTPQPRSRGTPLLSDLQTLPLPFKIQNLEFKIASPSQATSLPLRSMFEVRISIFTLLPHLAPLAESATVTDSPLQFSFHDLQPDLIKVSPLQAVEGPAGLAIEKAFFQHVGDYPLVYSPALARTSARVFADT